MRAAVLRAIDERIEVSSDVEAVGPGPGEVRIKIAASGVCHSDLSATNGTMPAMLPSVLGHEGAGIVVAVGDGVRNLVVDDHVILAFTPPCGDCADCLRGQPHLCLVGFQLAGTPRFKLGDEAIFGFSGLGTFAEELVVPQQAVVKIPDDVPLDVASLIGCGVTTGVGAALNTAKVRPGSSAIVFGCGGVGMSVIQGCRIAGAAEVVAVDLFEAKLRMAQTFGATHGVTPDHVGDVVAEITGGRGFDYGFEVIGTPATIRGAFDATRRGGTTIVVGVGRVDEFVQFSAFELFFAEKTLKGSMYGSADVRTDFHRLLKLWKYGKLDLEGMITRRIDVTELDAAFSAMRDGEVVRSVVEFSAQ